MKSKLITVILILSMFFPVLNTRAMNKECERLIPSCDLQMGCMGVSTVEETIDLNEQMNPSLSRSSIIAQLSRRLSDKLEDFDLNYRDGKYILAANVLDLRIALPTELPLDPETGSFVLPEDIQTLIGKALFPILQDNPEKFYLANGYSATNVAAISSTNGNIVARYLNSVDFILYQFDGLDYSDRNTLKSSFNAMLKEIESVTAPFLDSLQKAQLTDMEKVLLVHDYIISNCKYYTDIETNEQDIYHTMYSLFTQKTAVCEGYAKATNYLLKHLGISKNDIKLITSEKLKHMWNLIRLDGKWYHYDATADDPVFLNISSYNALWHEYFLISNSTNIQKRFRDDVSSYDGVCYDYEIISENDWGSSQYESGYLFNLDTMLRPFQQQEQNGSIDSPQFCYENGSVIFKTNLSRFNTDHAPIITFPAGTLRTMDYTFSLPYDTNDHQPASLDNIKKSAVKIISTGSQTSSRHTPQMIYAFYDENGFFCSMQTSEITDTQLDNSFLTVPENASIVKLFILDDTCTPLPLSYATAIE